jgi:hypothetical protein
MAAPTFALTAVVQDEFQFTGIAAQQAAATATPVNANQAQGAPAPADTVTLTNQAAEGQQTGQDPNPGRFDRAAFLGAAGALVGANRAPANPQPAQQAPSLPVLLPQLPAQNARVAAPANATDPAANQNPPANAAAAAAAANAANATDPAAAADTPQLELQQLDQTLLQLGVNPQSIPIANQLAMLLYANDPAGLELLVQALQTPAAQQGTTQAGANTGANTNAAATQALLQTAVQPNQGQPAQGPAQGAANQVAAANAANAPALSNPLSIQVQELQIAIQAVEIQTPQQANATAVGVTGNALNVTA